VTGADTAAAGALAPAEEALIRVSAALAARDEGSLDRALAEARAATGSAQIEEVLLQSYLFLGYPMALNGFARWRLLEAAAATEASPMDPEAWRERGGEVCRTVYGGQYPALRENVRALHPELETWMVTEGYGKVLGRPGLPLRLRELCIVALLVVLATPRQLYSHLRGALNAGAGTEEVAAAVAIAGSFASADARRAARDVWREVAERAERARAAKE
jgi:4-carboxymuconolactone decarboxylase